MQQEGLVDSTAILGTLYSLAAIETTVIKYAARTTSLE